MHIKSIIPSTLIVIFTLQISNASPFNEFEQNMKKYNLGMFNRTPQDINKCLAESGEKRKITTSEAFDAEVLKALDPKTYIPFAVEKSVTLDFRTTAEGWMQFTRISVQKDFRNPKVVVYVKERVTIDRDNLQIVFLGQPVTKADKDHLTYSGSAHFAEDVPPLFDVLHAIDVKKGDPINIWTISRHISKGLEDKMIMSELINTLNNTDVAQRSILRIFGGYLERKYGKA